MRGLVLSLSLEQLNSIVLVGYLLYFLHLVQVAIQCTVPLTLPLAVLSSWSVVRSIMSLIDLSRGSLSEIINLHLTIQIALIVTTIYIIQIYRLFHGCTCTNTYAILSRNLCACTCIIHSILICSNGTQK